jgi:hypothetical protein
MGEAGELQVGAIDGAAERWGATPTASGRLALALRVVGSAALRWSAFAVMNVLAIWNEGVPGTKLDDPILAITPFVGWVANSNYWIWLFAWLPWTLVLVPTRPERFIRFMISGAILSLLRGVGIVLTSLGPVRGPDVNLQYDWDWSLRWQVLGQLLNPIAVMRDQSANIWLTKDLFFSGHAATMFLLLLYVWPIRWLRWIVLTGNVAVVLTLFVGHIHYTIDVLGAWIVALALFVWRERASLRSGS